MRGIEFDGEGAFGAAEVGGIAAVSDAAAGIAEAGESDGGGGVGWGIEGEEVVTVVALDFCGEEELEGGEAWGGGEDAEVEGGRGGAIVEDGGEVGADGEVAGGRDDVSVGIEDGGVGGDPRGDGCEGGIGEIEVVGEEKGGRIGAEGIEFGEEGARGGVWGGGLLDAVAPFASGPFGAGFDEDAGEDALGEGGAFGGGEAEEGVVVRDGGVEERGVLDDGIDDGARAELVEGFEAVDALAVAIDGEPDIGRFIHEHGEGAEGMDAGEILGRKEAEVVVGAGVREVSIEEVGALV